MSTSIRLAIDVMGGDFGPRCIIPAVAHSLRQIPDLQVLLVGDAKQIEHLCNKHQLPSGRIRCIPTTQIILADDPPASVLRGKPDASMRVAIQQVRDGHADACLSAGNTGALMVLSRSILGTLDKIERPAIMAALPVAGKTCYLLDLGANVDCSALQLVQFAVMGAEAARELSGLSDPRIGLLNIGKEVNKGSQRVREASELLRQHETLNYIGHVEGDGLFRGDADVVVCDGFVGNVVLKASEGLASYMQAELRTALRANLVLRCLSPLLHFALRPMIRRHDPGCYNGASLLGLKGVVVKSHGGANEDAFSAAIDRAAQAGRSNLPQRIAHRLGMRPAGSRDTQAQ
ncbi:phosphate acyltransferase PlsX [uncultured Halopseudomonas sp.]|uniref:phosphate acyltransferase PlsX n=1 Tax=uncultured Halopseudomonas sp. TaxID=2901193 RepID=UPI0030ED3EBA